MHLSDAKRLKALKEKNRGLKSLVAAQALNIAALKQVHSQNGQPGA
jgi:hypothetical protein